MGRQGGMESGRRSGVKLILGMEVVSGIGDGVFWVGIIAVLLEEGVGARGFALAALARLGPRAIISAPAGVLADRLDRRRLLIALDLARAATMLVLAFAAAAGAEPAALLAIMLVTYTLAAPYRPALTAAMPLVAGERGLSSANALVGTTRQVMTFVGPLLGAIIVNWASPTAAFAVNAASFLVAAILVSQVRELAGRPAGHRIGLAQHREGWRSDLAGGWRAVRATTGLGVVTVLVFAMYAARGAELVLYALAAEERLGLGAAGIGVLTGAVGLGAVCALPAASRIAEADRTDVMLAASVGATAIPIAFLGVVQSAAAAVVALVVVGAGVVVFEVVSIVLLQRVADREVLGRVFGVVGTASNAGKLLGALAAPALVVAFDTGGALVACGLGVAVVGLLALPRLVSLTRSTRTRRAELRPIVDVLAGLGVFDGTSRYALERVAVAVRTERIDAGLTVLREGDPANDMYVVREGRFLVTDRGRQINQMDAGDWFGEIGLLQRRPRTATVTAVTTAVVWRIPGSTFLGAMEEMASEPTALIDVMTDRLSRSVGSESAAVHRSETAT